MRQEIKRGKRTDYIEVNVKEAGKIDIAS